MRGTLSQTRLPETHANVRADAFGRSPRAGLATSRFLLLALAVLPALGGCVDSSEADAANGPGAGIEAPGLAEASGPFEWPIDPSHPVLALVVELPGRGGTPAAPEEILIELMPELAPSSVVAVAELAKEGFYDGTTFHRVIPQFMIQGGDPNSRDRDPTNDGAGRNGRPLPDEYSEAPFVRTVVGMGNKGRANSASTQFFIMQSDKRNLDGRYNAIGRVVRGMDVVDRIAAVNTDRTGRWGPKDRPIENVRILSLRPVGQLATIRQVLELEDRRAAELADGGEAQRANAGLTVAQSGRDDAEASAPAAPGVEEWQRLEAGGR